MSRLVLAELRKVFSTRVWVWLLACAAVLTTVYAVSGLGFGDTYGLPPLDSPAGQRAIFSVGGGAGNLISILGAIAVTAEYRHGTATPTFLATPKRAKVIVAKLASQAMLGIGYGFVCATITLIIGVSWLSSRHIHIYVFGNGILASLIAVILALGIYAVLGTAVAILVRRQIPTILILLLYFFVVEPTLTTLTTLHGGTRYLPGAAADALVQYSQKDRMYLSPWQGGLVLAAYAAALALAGSLTSLRRDVG